MDRLKGKVAIVTGAAGGIGAAIARLFAEEGAHVMATDTQETNLKKWVQVANEEAGLSVRYMRHDVTEPTEWAEVIKTTVATYGHLDILVNNAGIYPPGATTESTSAALWDAVMSINVTAPFIGTQLCLPHMKQSGGGAVVNISSIAGIVGGNGAAYSASKGALRLLTKDHAVEFAKYNIRVNSIHPGGVLTPMTDFLTNVPGADEMIHNMCPMGRMGTATEIAYGALFLASGEASYVTGTELVIDGGLTAR